MAEQKENETTEVEQYEQLLNRLESEREKLEHELNKDYHQARRYVISHPEEGILAGLLGGITVGLIVGKLLK